MFELPVELWTKVFCKLQYKDLAVLSHTCSLFHTIARAQLYETIRLQEKFSSDSRLTQARRGSSSGWMFIEAFETNPSLAILVRTLDFISDRPMRCENNPILRELHLFYNLRSVALVAVEIDSNTCSTIQALPNLKSVSLRNCRIDSGVMEKPVEATVPSRIVDIELFNPLSDNVFFPAGVKLVSIGAYNKRDNSQDNVVERVLNRVTLTGLTRSVTTLVFKAIIPGTAIRFLETLPQLRHIFLPSPQSARIDILRSLPSSAIPLLETFSGPVDLCDVFLHGRPVHAVEIIVPTDVPQDFLRALQLSSVDILDLHLIFDADSDTNPTPTMGLLLQHAPETIQHLAWNSASKPFLQEVPDRSCPRLWSPVDKIGFMSCVPFLHRFPRLYTLRGKVIDPPGVTRGPRCYIEDPEMYEKNIQPTGQQELVITCAEASSSLRLVIFEGRERDGKWVKWADRTWEYYAVA